MSRRTVKASLIIDADLHARWCAAASLRNVPRNAIAVEALTSALKGVVCFDRARKPDSGKKDDRPIEVGDVNSAVEVDAA